MRGLKQAILYAVAMALMGVSALGLIDRYARPKPRFEDTAEPQRAVFHIQRGNTGIHGWPVYLNKPTPREGTGPVLKHKDAMVFVLSDAMSRIENSGRIEPSGHDNLLIVAMIHLERSETTNTGNPPLRIDVYSVVIDELIRVESFAR